ncbi:MAG: tetratricopeptide repeat protein [Rhodospirillales bacterium]|nr:tetratricopeptide repeat protein [Rhodospirillales bacterium]
MKAAQPNASHNDLLQAAGEFFQAGDFDQAAPLLEAVLRNDPENFDATTGMAIIHATRGNLDLAIPFFEKAAILRPADAEAHFNLGRALADSGRLDDAAAAYRRSRDINPREEGPHVNLGNLLKDIGDMAGAAECYRRALEINPNQVLTHSNLGNVLEKQGLYEDAVAAHTQALALDPNNAQAHSNLGTAFLEQGRLEDAAAAYRRAITIDPQFAVAHYNLGNTDKYLGRVEDGVASLRRSLECDPADTKTERSLLSALLNVPGLSPEDLFAEHLAIASRQTQAIHRIDAPFANDKNPDRRLRIGYLTSDFRDHPVGRNVFPLLSAHDPEKVEVVCYADVLNPDAMTERLRATAGHWREIAGMSDARVAAMIRADEIDVLVVLAGRFDRNRPLVAAYRAAPVQVSFHDGATSGLAEMDYWLTDGYLNPADTTEQFTEDLYRLPVFYQYPPSEAAPPPGPPPATQAGCITFASFNNPAKVNAQVIALWAEVLKSVPGSTLLLKYKNWYAQPSLQGTVTERFKACGIAPGRVRFEAASDTFTQHMGRYGAVDIALDPFPFNGATTTFQALSMGVPVITLKGTTFISRMAGSLLHQVGLGDLAVDTPGAYVTCAKNLAADLERLKTLRMELRQRLEASPLCGAPAYARSIEAAYREMWRKWCCEAGR